MKKPKSYKEVKSLNFDIQNIMTLDDFPKIKGPDLSKKITVKSLINSMATTGFQAANLSTATNIVKTMMREKAYVYLGFTSNMITSGVRDIVTYLAKNKKINAIVTTAGGVEEDIIKSLKPFVVGDFEASGKVLLQNGISRTGNIFIPNDRYLYFERFLVKLLERLNKKQKKTKKIISVTEITKELGKEIKNKESYLYWAAKNGIPVYCPPLTDGAFGDILYFFKKRHPEFKIDITDDLVKIEDISLNQEKTGAILLGGGVAKHHILNANILRGGLDYTVYINTGSDFDGSDSGARIDEAITWGKVNPDGLSIKVTCDATIAFPLIIIGALQ